MGLLDDMSTSATLVTPEELSDNEGAVGELAAGLRAMLVSPDGMMAAVPVQTEQEGVTARVEFLSTSTGELIDEFELQPGQHFSNELGAWTPDSRAFFTQGLSVDGSSLFLHRVGGGTGIYSADESLYLTMAVASDDTSTAVAQCTAGDALTILVATGEPGETPATTDPENGCHEVAQVYTPDDTPVALVSSNRYQRDAELHVVAPDGTLSTLAPPSEMISGNYSYQLTSCERVGLVSWILPDQSEGVAILQPETRSLVPTPTMVSATADQRALSQPSGRRCPVVSKDVTHAAFTTADGGVSVADLEAGSVTDVASTGLPIGFGASANTLVYHDGTTALADLGGGSSTAASAQADIPTNEGVPALPYCVAPGLGLVLVNTQDGIAVLDPDTNTSYVVPASPTRRAERCSVSADDAWVLYGDLAVELATESGVTLPGVDARDGSLTSGPGLGSSSHHDWLGVARSWPGHLIDPDDWPQGGDAVAAGQDEAGGSDGASCEPMGEISGRVTGTDRTIDVQAADYLEVTTTSDENDLGDPDGPTQFVHRRELRVWDGESGFIVAITSNGPEGQDTATSIRVSDAVPTRADMENPDFDPRGNNDFVYLQENMTDEGVWEAGVDGGRLTVENLERDVSFGDDLGPVSVDLEFVCE